ncbi:LOW QUALITY PROTEIN: protein-serine O-palmitoleoyltransferase porcupine [Procambarus clarkii]|uniref:LOW QUALITY PROTEIN: protein-serine O-palmitoleoyltransferase porcupine n=1 Tax=Procambarus clarkii TaxID=6728 RepID=UPI00374413DF
MADFAYTDYDYEYDQEGDGGDYVDYFDEDIYEFPVGEPWEEEEEEEEEDPASQFTLTELYEYCVVPTVSDSYLHLCNLLVWSLVFTLTTRIVRPPAWLVHMASTACGGVVAWHLFGLRTGYMACLTGVGSLALVVTHLATRSRRGPWTCAACVAFLIFCELWWADPIDWHSIRGPQMVILMKLVSVGYDLDAATLASAPNPLEMAGYVMNPGTIIFGPWISFGTYLKVLQPLPWSLWLIPGIVIRLTASIMFLLMSTCYTSWLLPDSINRWGLAYREALSFRLSHYFVSYLSEASALLAGLNMGKVARPYFIEIPRSLVEVVIYWNVPMHHWLKTYVFKTARNHLGIFWALLLTYSMSALFHGLNFQLAAVLLSLGFYTFVEYSLRAKLSSVFDACILARPCSDTCLHKQKARSWFSLSTNLVFTVLTVFHLAYLGIMFDSSSQQQETGYSMIHTLNKWQALNYASHWVMFICYVMYSVI